MENASKALIIAGAVLLSILLIAIGMLIFNAAQDPLQQAAGAMDQQAKDTFNAVWEAYDGNQTGSNVKTLLSKAVTNAKTNEAELTFIPKIICSKPASGNIANIPNNIFTNASGSQGNYINNVGKLRNAIEARHMYKVEIAYSDLGLVNEITIKYDI